ncbi:MAG: peptidylprolyl isomerase [Anaerolineaceae bacterium]|nr:peptidylprolyl isomerase [Anaerolineaceae bacterium]
MSKQTEQQKLVTRKHIARQEKEQHQIRTILIISGIVLFAVLVLVLYSLVHQLYTVPNKAVATIGDKRITSKEFETNVKYARLTTLNQAASYIEYAQMFGSMGSNFMSTAKSLVDQLNNPTNFGKNVLDRMIDDQLIKEQADKLGIKVSDAELGVQMQEVFGFFPNGTLTPTITPTMVNTPTLSGTQIAIIKPTDTPTPAPTLNPTEVHSTESALSNQATATAQAQPTKPASEQTPTAAGPTAEPSITPTPTVYTTQVYGKEVSKYTSMLKQYGLSYQDMQNLVRSQMLRDKLRDEMTKDMKPIQEQVWVRHILLATEEEANKVLDEIKAGTDFAEAAKKYGTDGTKDNGGDLGWMGLEDQNWDKEFVKAAFTLTKVGEVSAPVKTQFGYHLIQLVGRAENPVTEYKFEELKASHFANWLAETKASRTDIKIEPAWADAVPAIPAVPAQIQSIVDSAVTPK